jgi:hypothetical protein
VTETETGATETRRTLRALADRRRRSDDPSAVVREATAALASVEAGARFLADGGEARLARALAGAVRDGADEETVRRGREALAALRALETALDGDARTAAAGRPTAAGGGDAGEGCE